MKHLLKTFTFILLLTSLSAVAQDKKVIRMHAKWGLGYATPADIDSIVFLNLLPPSTVSATLDGYFVNIQWEDEDPTFSYWDFYEVYHSTDNVSYQPIASVHNRYSYIHTAPSAGQNYYKVVKGLNGYWGVAVRSDYSEAVVSVNFPYTLERISPYDELGNPKWVPYQSEDGSHGDAWMGDMTNSTIFNLMFADNASPDQVGDAVWCATLFFNNSIPGWGSIPQSQLPIYITIDLGEEVTPNLMRFKAREKIPYGTARYMVDFDVWGSLHPKTDTDFKVGGIIDTVASLAYWTGWQEVLVQTYNGNSVSHTINGNDGWTQDGSWTKLHSQERLYSVLPSGIKYHSEWPDSYLSADDENFFLNEGFSFQFDQPSSIRYLRFRIFDTSDHSGRNEIQYLELLRLIQ